MTNPITMSDQLGEMIAACFTTGEPESKRTENKGGDRTTQIVARCRADAEFVGERVKAMARALNGQVVKSNPDCIIVAGADGTTKFEVRLEIERSKQRLAHPLSGKGKSTKAALAN